jgi:4'-phosphopantetheinyl transferase
VVDAGELSDALVARWAVPADHAYAARRRRGEASLRALAALRGLLFVVTGEDGWRVVRTPLGKPCVVNAAGQSGPAISLSHSRGLAAVAVARAEAVGIDVERHRARDAAALAAQAFGPAERAEVAAGGLGAFYRIWTLREAMAKATGDGLALAANRFDLAEDVASGGVVLRDRAMRRWQLFHTQPDPDNGLAVAWIGGDATAPPCRIDLAVAAAARRGD